MNMSRKPSKEKKDLSRFPKRGDLVASPKSCYESESRHNLTDNFESKKELTCVRVNDSYKSSIYKKMSYESIKISDGTKWSERGYIPSFKKTDKTLMKAARRTYKSHGINYR